MAFGNNLQYLRKMHRGMTQEELAKKMDVSRQTISKWEMGSAYPEMEKALLLCKLFACSLDELMRKDMQQEDAAYQNMHIEEIPAFHYIRYVVISCDPEGDALHHIQEWAALNGIVEPSFIGWDFPILSQEQINVYHMHGYSAACILPEGYDFTCTEIQQQNAQKYAVLTIADPFNQPFVSIPNAFKTLLRYMEANDLTHKMTKDIIDNFERVYEKDGMTFMDIHIAIEPYFPSALQNKRPV